MRECGSVDIPVSSVILNIGSQQGEDCSVELFSLSVGLLIVRGFEPIVDVENGADIHKQFENELGSISGEWFR